MCCVLCVMCWSFQLAPKLCDKAKNKIIYFPYLHVDLLHMFFI